MKSDNKSFSIKKLYAMLEPKIVGPLPVRLIRICRSIPKFWLKISFKNVDALWSIDDFSI